MIRGALVLALTFALPAAAQQAASASAGVVRVLDKTTGIVTDIELATGETRVLGSLSVTMGDCRYPPSNPSGDAWVQLVIRDARAAEPVFSGWMIASAPALSALDHARYDVWALRCVTS